MAIGRDGGGQHEIGNDRLSHGRLKLALTFAASVIVATLVSIVNRELKLESLPPSTVVQRKTGVTTPSNMTATFPTEPVIGSNLPPQGRNATTTSKLPVIVSNPVQKQQQRLNSTPEAAATADGSFTVTAGIPDSVQKQQSQTTDKTTTTTTSSSSCRNVTTSVYLSGELGNNLHKIAYAKAIQFIAEEENIMSKLDLKMRSQGLAKSRRAAKDVHQCFASIRRYDMAECNNVAYDESLRRQDESLGGNASMLKVAGACEYDCIHEKLQFLDRLRTDHSCDDDDGWVTSGCKLNGTEDCTKFPLPILVANEFVHKSLVDRFYDKIRDYFAFDEGACCKERPFPDETVYHFRGFGHEMPRVGRRGKFRELSPNQTANELFADLGPGDKLAIVSRFDDKATKPLVDALSRKGVIVRMIQKQTGVQDFCFMYSAQKELVGTASSTFLIWAGYLSKSVKRVRMYIVEDRKEDLGNGVYNYTHPVLKGRMHFQPILFEKYDYKNVF